MISCTRNFTSVGEAYNFIMALEKSANVKSHFSKAKWYDHQWHIVVHWNISK